MSTDRPRVATGSPTTRLQVTNNSRVTNDLLAPLPGTDGRSPWARRRRDLIKSFAAAIGRTLSERDRVLVTTAAALTVRIEQVQASIANGAPIDDDQLIRLANVLQRTLATLGLDGRKPAPATDDDDVTREYLGGAAA